MLALAIMGLSVLAPIHAQAQLGEQENVDVVLIIDVSGSMAQSDPEGIRVSAAKLFFDLSRDGDRIAVISMSGESDTEVKIKLTRLSSWFGASDPGRRRLKEDLNVFAEAPGKYTFMGKALNLAYDVLDTAGPGRQQYVVMLTDGTPTGEPADVLNEALAKFERKRYWKVFPVALGPEPDFAFLQNRVAAPTNGIAFKAATPADLIRVYTEIFALTRQNHYVNWVKVAPNMLQSLGTVTADQQVTHLAVIIPKSNRQPDVEVLVGPNGRNLVDPAERGGLYWAEDPRYEVYVIPRQSLPSEGLWKIRLNNPGEVEIALLARSNLALQLQSPAPRAPWEELSERYHPAGERLLVQMAIQRHLTGIEAIMAESSQGQSIGSQYQFFLTPAVKLSQLTDRPIILRDDGLFSDYTRDDGVYRGRSIQPLEVGRYVVEFEVPSLKMDTLRLVKQRSIEVLDVPRIQLKLPDQPLNLGPVTLEAAFSQPTAGSVPTLSEALMFWIREPDGHTYTTPAVQAGDRYQAQISITQAGKYQIAAQANANTESEGRAIPYTTYDEGELVVVKPEITVQTQPTDLGQVAELSDLRVQVQLTSNSIKAETLNVQVSGLADASIVPATVAIGPKETKTVEFSVGTKSLAAVGSGSFDLVFSAGDAATVVNDSVAFSYEVVQGIQISVLKTDFGELSKLSDLQVQMWARSSVARVESLTVCVEGLGEKAQIFPATLQVPPQEETAFTLMIEGAKAETKGLGSFDIVLQPASSSVVVSPDRMTFSYELPKDEGGIGDVLLIGILVLVIVALVVFLVLRRRRR